ncbi:MAG TPA: hypothetical protein VNQ77_12030 [Frankiaceae bacterium]|nr:hypothetical protein [Frankiaceae bacterium]
MHRRLVPAAALGGVLLLSSSAGAAPRSCQLVKDPRGDMHPVAPVGSDNDLDILSADLATDKTYVTAVVRTVSMRGATSPDSPTGRAWEVWFTAGEETFIMAAHALANGYDGIVYHVDGEYEAGPEAGAYTGTGIGPARVTFDTVRREVRITAPLRHFTPFASIVRGRILHNLRAGAFKMVGNGPVSQSTPLGYGTWIGSGGVGTSQDLAFSKRTYDPGTPSCVAVGK